MKRIALALIFLLAFTLPSEAKHKKPAPPEPVAEAAAPQAVLPQSSEQITLSFAPLVKRVAPAVVNIYTQRVVQQRVSPLFSDPLFRQFFGDQLPPGMNRQRLENSLGSGVIVRADGLIVTSNHVISGADQIRVVLTDRREFDAKVLTSDERSDLAVLRVDMKGEKLPYIELKDSDTAQIGDLVLAIGNPFGVGQTVTSGIVSAVAHGAVGSSDLDYYIQTDAAINPGNSGGALVTMDGKLAGINAAIYSRDGGNMGIGFAVPANMVKVVLGAVEQGKKSIIRPWLGIEGQAVTPELAASMSLSRPVGMLVNSIHSSSPAGKAGLKVGDVILSVSGHDVEDPEAFRYRIATLGMGSTADIGLLRKGEPVTIHVQMIPPPEDPMRETTPISGHNPLSGTTLVNLSPAVIEEMGAHGAEHGVIVSKVDDGSPAASVGMQPGDIIIAINGKKIGSVHEVNDALQKQANSWRVNVQRGDNSVTIVVGG